MLYHLFLTVYIPIYICTVYNVYRIMFKHLYTGTRYHVFSLVLISCDANLFNINATNNNSYYYVLAYLFYFTSFIIVYIILYIYWLFSGKGLQNKMATFLLLSILFNNTVSFVLINSLPKRKWYS